MQVKQFGKYMLLERIAIGGMAEVYKAKSLGVEGFEKLLAIKRILPSVAEDEEFITMFIDEAKISVQLSHANIAQIFDLGRIEDSFFIAMEFVHGKDLRTIWERHRRRGLKVPIPMSAYVLARVCEGLDYAHRKKDAAGHDLNIVHRDVSPQNVLLSYEGEVKIIDFGIAKAANKASRTQAGILKGKFGYMSPEQVRGLPLDRRSDVFSVGIVLYELLSGERLFSGSSDFSTLEKIRKADILPPTTFNRNIPVDLERIVIKALAKEPNDRYQSAYDLQEDLQRFLIKSGTIFTRKDLTNYLKKAFKSDIERELERNKQFESIKIESTVTPVEPVITEVQGRPVPPEIVQAEEEEDEEIETVVWDPRSAQEQSTPPRPIEVRPMVSESPALVPTAAPPTVPSSTPPSFRALPPPLVKPVPEIPPQDTLTDPTPQERPVFFDEKSSSTGDITVSETNSMIKRRRRFNLLIILLAAAALGLFGFSLFRLLRMKGFLGGGATVVFHITPADGQLLFDGQPAPPRLDGVKPGRHLVEAQAPNYQPFRQEIDLAPGEAREISVSLSFVPGTLVLSFRPPDARVTLEGSPVEGVSPLRLQLVPGREYLIEVSHPAYETAMLKATVEPRKETIREVALAEKLFRLKLTSEPSEAEALLDDQSKGKTPLEIGGLKCTGQYLLTLRKQGFAPWSGTIFYDGNPLREVNIQLEAEAPSEAPAPPPKPGRPPRHTTARPTGDGAIAVNSTPWGKVFIDGKDTGKHTPLLSHTLPAGTHTVTVKFNNGGEASRKVEVKVNEKVTVILNKL